MNTAAKKALKKIDTTEMFSKDGWKQVHKECGHLQKSPHTQSDLALGQGFTEYMIIWYEDNNVSEEDFEDINIEDRLLSRFTDYLERD